MLAQECAYFPTLMPRADQLAFQEWEFGLFLHFGIRTFYEDHADWDGKPMPPEAFNPSELDCKQWVRLAKEAGAKYLVLTAKHHDGFVLWPSRYTDYSVASTPWKQGQGDVVREFTDACAAYEMKVGLYYSPFDVDMPKYDDPTQYDDYFINQIGELLTNYGEVNIIWLDGAGCVGHQWDWPRIFAAIRRMQPSALVFHIGDADFRWGGNEGGVGPYPNWNTAEYEGYPARWLPAECDTLMRKSWFYSSKEEHTVRGLDELLGVYYYSVGRGCNLLLNIGPDQRGLLPEKDSQRLLQLGAEIRRRFSQPRMQLDAFTREGDVWEHVRPGGQWQNMEHPLLIDHAVLMEDLAQGETIRRFAIDVVPPFWNAGYVTIYEGRNIGHKAICRFPQVAFEKIRLRVLEADGPVRLRAFDLFNTVGERE